MRQNMSLGSSGVERVRSLRKIPTRLCVTNFCTSSARFALSFVRQLNDPKWTQIVQNTPKHEFRVQWDGSGAFVAKNSDATLSMNFCTSSPCFAQCFESQPNYPKCTQIVQKTPKHNFRMQWDRVRSLQKISMRLRGNELFALVRSILHRVS